MAPYGILSTRMSFNHSASINVNCSSSANILQLNLLDFLQWQEVAVFLPQYKIFFYMKSYFKMKNKMFHSKSVQKEAFQHRQNFFSPVSSEMEFRWSQLDIMKHSSGTAYSEMEHGSIDSSLIDSTPTLLFCTFPFQTSWFFLCCLLLQDLPFPPLPYVKPLTIHPISLFIKLHHFVMDTFSGHLLLTASVLHGLFI